MCLACYPLLCRSTDASILLDCIQRALPEGVHLSMMEHSDDLEEQRWIADPFIDKVLPPHPCIKERQQQPQQPQPTPKKKSTLFLHVKYRVSFFNWSPLKFSKNKTPCNLVHNFYKGQRL